MRLATLGWRLMRGCTPCSFPAGHARAWRRYTSQYVVNAAQRFPVRYSWNPVFQSKQNGGMCMSYEDSAVFYLLSPDKPATRYIEDFASKVVLSSCKPPPPQ